MRVKNIVITEADYTRLRALVASSRICRQRDTEHLDQLERELDRATISDNGIPKGVVMMNSRVRVRDLNTGHEFDYHIVFPKDADVARNRISVLAPIGTALLGYGAGTTVEWKAPSGVRRWRILEAGPASVTRRVAA
jgi:regulator of nucleoside diphosphate kinase